MPIRKDTVWKHLIEKGVFSAPLPYTELVRTKNGKRKLRRYSKYWKIVYRLIKNEIDVGVAVVITVEGQNGEFRVIASIWPGEVDTPDKVLKMLKRKWAQRKESKRVEPIARLPRKLPTPPRYREWKTQIVKLPHSIAIMTIGKKLRHVKVWIAPRRDTMWNLSLLMQDIVELRRRFKYFTDNIDVELVKDPNHWLRILDNHFPAFSPSLSDFLTALRS